MSIVSSKRQITLPIEQCRLLGIQPGDEVEIFAAHGMLTIVKKKPGAARGLLKHLKPDKRFSDEASLRSSLR